MRLRKVSVPYNVQLWMAPANLYHGQPYLGGLVKGTPMYWAKRTTVFACACMLASTLSAQQIKPKQPQKVSDYSVGSAGEGLKYSRFAQMGGGVAAQNAGTLQHVVSVPHWSGKFTANDGSTYPFVMVGSDPSSNTSVSIKTALVPVSLSFDGYIDPNGNPLVIDATPIVKLAMTSPNFESYNYGTGFTQFADAVQLAQFHKYNKGGWHTLLAAPRVLTPVTIEVPAGFGDVFITNSGKVFAKVDSAFFTSQVSTITQLEGLQVDEIPILLAPNVLLYDGGDEKNCCLLGFHTAYQTKVSGSARYIQTLIFATWLEQGIYQDPGMADAITLSHEIAETINDPFVNNTAPPWQDPSGASCQALVETGDPIEGLPHPAFEVMLHGMTYHPQTEALLQWFTQRPHSDAFEEAWSYPDTHALEHSAKPCSQ